MNKKDGFVGILVANRNQRNYVLKQYLRHNTTHLKLFCFTPSSINWDTRSIIGLHRSNHKWLLSRFSFPRVVYNRCYGTNQELIERLGSEIGSHKCFNQINQFNKLEIYDRLNRWLFDYLPQTIRYEKDSIPQLLEQHKILYFKPIYGHRGKGVYRAELKNTGDIHIGLHYFSPETIVKDSMQLQENIDKLIDSTPYIIQRGIAIKQINHKTFDIRSLVQRNESGLWSVTNLVSRIAYKGSYNTSIYEKVCLSQQLLKRLYPPGKVNAIIRSIYDISLRTAEIIDTETNYHLGEFSVDIALDHNAHPWIIELNGKPQKDLYNSIRRHNAVYIRPLQYARYLYKH